VYIDIQYFHEAFCFVGHVNGFSFISFQRLVRGMIYFVFRIFLSIFTRYNELPHDNRRLELFTTVFSNVMIKSYPSGEVKLLDLVNEVNDRMIVNNKFDEKEVKECLRELDKKERLMFQEDDGYIFLI